VCLLGFPFAIYSHFQAEFLLWQGNVHVHGIACMLAATMCMAHATWQAVSTHFHHVPAQACVCTLIMLFYMCLAGGLRMALSRRSVSRDVKFGTQCTV
jgi:hypothetical protein